MWEADNHLTVARRQIDMLTVWRTLLNVVQSNSVNLASEKGSSMAKATFFFPEDFRWGTATSSHQVEGDNSNNDWWAWEHQPDRILNGHRSGLACNWWNKAEEDLDRAAAMGTNAHRLSIEWSRVEPQPGVYDDATLDRYRQILQALHQRNMEPMVTLHHFTNPLWLAQRGGWVQEGVIAAFERYVRWVVERLGDLVPLWCTINEPMVYAVLAFMEAKFPPGRSSVRLASQVVEHMLRAHAVAYHAIHEVQPDAKVGIVRNFRLFEPANPGSPLDRWAAGNLDYLFNEAFNRSLVTGRLRWPLGRGRVKGMAHSFDFYGLNYYTRDMVAFDPLHPGQLFSRRFYAPDARMSDNDHGEIYPEGMYHAIRRAAVYRRPIYITENGLPDADDDQRPRFILSHLRQVWAALQENIPIMGYYHWSLIDNFEWERGWVERFGLIELDVPTQGRRLRRSGELYGRICQARALDHAMVAQYAPDLLDEMFPG